MGIISIGKGNIEFHSVDRALKYIKLKERGHESNRSHPCDQT